jgi:hypothetical protein
LWNDWSEADRERQPLILYFWTQLPYQFNDSVELGRETNSARPNGEKHIKKSKNYLGSLGKWFA